MGIWLISVRLNAPSNWVNAALVGANTVSLAVLRVLANVGSPPGAVVARVTAFTSESSPLATAVSTILPEGGINTRPMI